MVRSSANHAILYSPVVEWRLMLATPPEAIYPGSGIAIALKEMLVGSPYQSRKLLAVSEGSHG